MTTKERKLLVGAIKQAFVEALADVQIETFKMHPLTHEAREPEEFHRFKNMGNTQSTEDVTS